MFSQQVLRIRAAILAVLGFVGGFGLLPEGLENVVEANADAVVGGVLGLWAIVAFLSSLKKGKEAEDSE